jgi:hypothetical protein
VLLVKMGPLPVVAVVVPVLIITQEAKVLLVV